MDRKQKAHKTRLDRSAEPKSSRESGGPKQGISAPSRSSVAQAGNLQLQHLLRGDTGLDVTHSKDPREQEASRISNGIGSSISPLAPMTAGLSRSTPTALPAGLPGDLGRPLHSASREAMEPMFGANLGHVRVHDSPVARGTADRLSARAFTHGSHVWLGKGAREDDHGLMAHELTHVVQQDSMAKPSVMRQPIGPALPPQVDLTKVSLSFEIPGGKALNDKWNDLSTTNPTTVSISITPAGLDMSFSPALLIDAQYPWSDMEWSGATYDFAAGAISSIGLADTQSLAPASGQDDARADISSFFVSLLAGTPMAKGGYDPLTDPDIAGTLNQIKSNWTSAPSSGSEVNPADISRITLSASIKFRSPVTAGTPQANVVASGGASIVARFKGTGADVAGGATPTIEWITIAADSLIVQKNGEDVAQIHSVTVNPGGSVTIDRMTLLGPAKKAAGTESALRLGLLILLLSQGGPNDRLAVADKNPPLDAEIVPGLTRHAIQEAATEAVRKLIIDNADAIPGYDLKEIFGFPKAAPAPGDYNPGLPGEGPNRRYG